MNNLSFRFKLVIAVALLLVAVQGVNYISISDLTRERVIEDANDDLATARALFEEILVDRAILASKTASITVSDFALKTALSDSDLRTKLSVVENARQRVEAELAAYVTLDGNVEVSTAVQTLKPGQRFQYQDLLDRADRSLDAYAFGIGELDGNLYLISAVAIDSPATIGYFLSAVPTGEAFVRSLTDKLPNAVEARIQARDDMSSIINYLPADQDGPAAQLSSDGMLMFTAEIDGDRTVVNLTPLPAAVADQPIDLVLSVSIRQALARSQPLFDTLGILLAAALIVAVGLSLVFANNLARPLINLTNLASKVEDGDYGELPDIDRRDEIGRLTSAFSTMISRVKRREAELRYQARHDIDTNLLNRDTLTRELHHLKKAKGHVSGVIALEIETLDDINHVFGRNIGLETANAIAERMRTNTPPGGLLARVDDTNFAIGLAVRDLQDLQEKAHAVMAALEQPVQVGGSSLNLQARAAVAMDTQAQSAATLLQMADAALYRGRGGIDTIIVYDPARDEPNTDLFTLMADVRPGLENGEFKLFLQPKIDLRSGEIREAEGLIRWFHPERGFIPPDHFISLAERTGKIGDITRWVINEAADLAARFKQLDIDCGLAVNLSARDLLDNSLPDVILDAVGKRGLDVCDLRFEITENELMQDPDKALAILDSLRDRGMHLAVDDFGTGYSSLEYLRRLPVSEIKIDRSFIQHIVSNEGDQVITRAAIDMGHGLGLKVTAEGVEDRQTVDYLRKLGCNTAQGYYFSKPISQEDFITLCKDWAYDIDKAG